MGNNPSVAQFRTNMQDLVKTVGMNFHERTLAQADEIMENMRRAIPHSVTGHEAQSIRKRDVTKTYGTLQRVSVFIFAGGPLTTKKLANGDTFDYVIASEFGTVNQSPQPFFYGTYRLYKRLGLEQYRETLEQTIRENNIVRNLRSQNYSNSAGTRTVGHRGAVVIQNR